MNKKLNLRDFIYSALFAALTIALGFISIPLPISPVPISGISLGIMLTGSVLSVRQAFYSVLTIILLGAAGLPVFSGFTGGLGVLFGPRGGYYLGFLFGAATIALLRQNSNNLFRLFFSNIIGGIFVVYSFAVVWLSLITQMNLHQSFMVGVLPFIVGDTIKALIASMLAIALKKHRFMT